MASHNVVHVTLGNGQFCSLVGSASQQGQTFTLECAATFSPASRTSGKDHALGKHANLVNMSTINAQLPDQDADISAQSMVYMIARAHSSGHSAPTYGTLRNWKGAFDSYNMPLQDFSPRGPDFVVEINGQHYFICSHQQHLLAGQEYATQGIQASKSNKALYTARTPVFQLVRDPRPNVQHQGGYNVLRDIPIELFTSAQYGAKRSRTKKPVKSEVAVTPDNKANKKRKVKSSDTVSPALKQSKTAQAQTPSSASRKQPGSSEDEDSDNNSVSSTGSATRDDHSEQTTPSDDADVPMEFDEDQDDSAQWHPDMNWPENDYTDPDHERKERLAAKWAVQLADISAMPDSVRVSQYARQPDSDDTNDEQFLLNASLNNLRKTPGLTSWTIVWWHHRHKLSEMAKVSDHARQRYDLFMNSAPPFQYAKVRSEFSRHELRVIFDDFDGSDQSLVAKILSPRHPAPWRPNIYFYKLDQMTDMKGPLSEQTALNLALHHYPGSTTIRILSRGLRHANKELPSAYRTLFDLAQANVDAQMIDVQALTTAETNTGTNLQNPSPSQGSSTADGHAQSLSTSNLPELTPRKPKSSSIREEVRPPTPKFRKLLLLGPIQMKYLEMTGTMSVNCSSVLSSVGAIQRAQDSEGSTVEINEQVRKAISALKPLEDGIIELARSLKDSAEKMPEHRLQLLDEHGERDVCSNMATECDRLVETIRANNKITELWNQLMEMSRPPSGVAQVHETMSQVHGAVLALHERLKKLFKMQRKDAPVTPAASEKGEPERGDIAQATILASPSAARSERATKRVSTSGAGIQAQVQRPDALKTNGAGPSGVFAEPAQDQMSRLGDASSSPNKQNEIGAMHRDTHKTTELADEGLLSTASGKTTKPAQLQVAGSEEEAVRQQVDSSIDAPTTARSAQWQHVDSLGSRDRSSILRRGFGGWQPADAEKLFPTPATSGANTEHLPTASPSSAGMQPLSEMLRTRASTREAIPSRKLAVAPAPKHSHMSPAQESPAVSSSEKSPVAFSSGPQIAPPPQPAGTPRSKQQTAPPSEPPVAPSLAPSPMQPISLAAQSPVALPPQLLTDDQKLTRVKVDVGALSASLDESLKSFVRLSHRPMNRLALKNDALVLQDMMQQTCSLSSALTSIMSSASLTTAHGIAQFEHAKVIERKLGEALHPIAELISQISGKVAAYPITSKLSDQLLARTSLTLSDLEPRLASSLRCVNRSEEVLSVLASHSAEKTLALLNHEQAHMDLADLLGRFGKKFAQDYLNDIHRHVSVLDEQFVPKVEPALSEDTISPSDHDIGSQNLPIITGASALTTPFRENLPEQAAIIADRPFDLAPVVPFERPETEKHRRAMADQHHLITSKVAIDTLRKGYDLGKGELPAGVKAKGNLEYSAQRGKVSTRVIEDQRTGEHLEVLNEDLPNVEDLPLNVSLSERNLRATRNKRRWSRWGIIAYAICNKDPRVTTAAQRVVFYHEMETELSQMLVTWTPPVKPLDYRTDFEFRINIAEDNLKAQYQQIQSVETTSELYREELRQCQTLELTLRALYLERDHFIEHEIIALEQTAKLRLKSMDDSLSPEARWKNATKNAEAQDLKVRSMAQTDEGYKVEEKRLARLNRVAQLLRKMFLSMDLLKPDASFALKPKPPRSDRVSAAAYTDGRPNESSFEKAGQKMLDAMIQPDDIRTAEELWLAKRAGERARSIPKLGERLPTAVAQMKERMIAEDAVFIGEKVEPDITRYRRAAWKVYLDIKKREAEQKATQESTESTGQAKELKKDSAERFLKSLGLD